MTRHDPISAESRTSRKGRKPAFRGPFPAHLEGPPGEWTLDALGCPLWISRIPDADGGPWVWIIPPRNDAVLLRESGWSDVRLQSLLEDGPAAMPSMGRKLGARLRGEHLFGSQRPGRPPLERADPQTARWSAWLADMRDGSVSEIARRLVNRGNERSARRRAERYLHAGRSLLGSEGVVPWVLWPRGEVPVGWWADGLFYLGLKDWYDLYVARNRNVIAAAREAAYAAIDAGLATAALRRAVDQRVAEAEVERDI